MITLGAESASATLEPASDESVVRHSHYYDAALHRAITETGDVGGRVILERAAASAAFRALAGSPVGDAARALAALFDSTGLGVVGKCEVSIRGAEISVAPSSYVRARVEMFGRAAGPTCDVARGVIAGALGAIQGTRYLVREVACVAAGAKACSFVATPAEMDGGDELPRPFDWPGRALAPAIEGASAPGEPRPEIVALDGAASAVSHGKLWAELYARAAFDFEEAVPREMGSKFNNLASVVLTEAAHLGTFYSLGGLVRSEEWRSRVVPVIPAREDWVHAIIALVDSYGWGAWRVQLLAPEQRFTVHVHDGYEALSSLALSGGLATSPRCFFSRGFVGGLMNVLFSGDVLSPAALNQAVYNSLFRSPSSFRALETRCQAMGHPYCEFVANPLSPGLRRG